MDKRTSRKVRHERNESVCTLLKLFGIELTKAEKKKCTMRIFKMFKILQEVQGPVGVMDKSFRNCIENKTKLFLFSLYFLCTRFTSLGK